MRYCWSFAKCEMGVLLLVLWCDVSTVWTEKSPSITTASSQIIWKLLIGYSGCSFPLINPKAINCNNPQTKRDILNCCLTYHIFWLHCESLAQIIEISISSINNPDSSSLLAEQRQRLVSGGQICNHLMSYSVYHTPRYGQRRVILCVLYLQTRIKV